MGKVNSRGVIHRIPVLLVMIAISVTIGAHTNGLRRVVLENRISSDIGNNNRPILNQQDFSYANTIYVVKYDFVLAGEIRMPANCMLEFEGGSFRGGKIVGNNTSINLASYSIFNDCVIEKFNLPYVDPRWVGAIPDFNENNKTGTDNSSYFQMAYDNIADNHPGIDILIIGKYLISKTVIFRQHCHLKGFHNNTRGLIIKHGLQDEIGTSVSMVAVGECPAFRVVGKENESRTWADLSIEHIKFYGLNKMKSVAIQYEASGSPTRPAFIEKCEACNLLYFFHTIANERSNIGNLTIRENNIYNCNKAIYAIAEKKELMTLTSLKVADNLIEHNGDKCIHLNGCFGPIIIDNNILEGQSNPIYLSDSWCAPTNYVISNNYFEYPKDDDKKIHVDGFVLTDGGDRVTFQTSVDIYGNTSAYGYAVELNGVQIKRLDRIDTPAKGNTNCSVFTHCLFDNIDVSDIYVSQFRGWNLSTEFPFSKLSRKNALTVETGNDLLSFDDCKGSTHMNQSSRIKVPTIENDGKESLIIAKFSPRLTKESKRLYINYNYCNKNYYLGVDLPREVPYFAFLVYKKDKGNDISNNNNVLSAYVKETDIEMGDLTIYNNVNSALYNYPYISQPYSHNE